MRVPARYHQGQHRKTQPVFRRSVRSFNRGSGPRLLQSFQQHRVNMAFKVIHGDQRLPHGERQSFGVADADQQRSRQARTLRDGHSINADVIDLGCF